MCIASTSPQMPELTLSKFGQPHQTLPNRDLDTGSPVHAGGYRLTDDTYAKLLHRVAADPHDTVPPGLKSDILNYYADPAAPIHTKKYPAKWPKFKTGLQISRPCREQPTHAPETE